MSNKAKNQKIREFFFFLGPILASFHVATYIVGFFSVGAVARWIIEQWFPFTRWVWTELHAILATYVEIPELNIIEKDALTTAVFFAPLGLYAFTTSSSHPLDGKYKWFAPVLGIFFLCVVGFQLVSAVVNTAFNTAILTLPATIFGWIALAFLGSAICWAAIDVVRENRAEGKSEIVPAIGIPTLFFPAVLTVINMAENIFTLGWVTFACFLIVGTFASAASLKTPYRLSWSLGGLIAFILSGLAFEFILFIVGFIEQTPK